MLIENPDAMIESSSTRHNRLRVEIIDTYTEFEAVKPAWERLSAKDPESTVFLSWAWMAEAFRKNPYRWSVIVVRDSAQPDDFVCVLPLKYRSHWSRSKKEFQSEIEAGGRLMWSEYTGFLCDPQFEKAALRAVSAALVNLPWAKLSLRYVLQSHRTEVFCAAFAKADFKVDWKEYRINKGDVDNLVCPFVALPEDFESYLKEQISANTRQKYRRFLRRLEAGELRFSHSDASTVERDIDILIKFWREKWRTGKGKSQADQVADNYRRVLMAAQKTGTLYLPVLWRGKVPLGALGHVVDQDRGRVHFIVAGRDGKDKDPFIGTALHFYSIQSAIDHGYEAYDFCHGNEKYKYSFGVKEQTAKYFTIERRKGNVMPLFDSINTGEALRRTVGFLEEGRADKAMQACKQLSDLLS